MAHSVASSLATLYTWRDAPLCYWICTFEQLVDLSSTGTGTFTLLKLISSCMAIICPEVILETIDSNGFCKVYFFKHFQLVLTAKPWPLWCKYQEKWSSGGKDGTIMRSTLHARKHQWTLFSSDISWSNYSFG